MNFLSPGIEKRIPKAAVLHKQFQEAEAVLSYVFPGFDHHSLSLAVHQHCLQCGTACSVALPIEMQQFTVQVSQMQIICPLTHVRPYGAW